MIQSRLETGSDGGTFHVAACRSGGTGPQHVRGFVDRRRTRDPRAHCDNLPYRLPAQCPLRFHPGVYDGRLHVVNDDWAAAVTQMLFSAGVAVLLIGRPSIGRIVGAALASCLSMGDRIWYLFDR